MVTVKKTLAAMTWCGLAILMATLYFKPRFDECTSYVKTLQKVTASSYSFWQGCQVEIIPGTWASWEEIPLRAPYLLESAGCVDDGGTRCA